MSTAELDELRRLVLNMSDQRVHAERAAAQRFTERRRAAEIVRAEIRAYLAAGGDPAELHELLDRTVDDLRPAAGSGTGSGTSTPVTPPAGAGGGTGG